MAQIVTDGGRLLKQTPDDLNCYMDFADQPEVLDGTEILDTAAVVITGPDAVLTSAAVGVDDTRAVFRLLAGTPGGEYVVTVTGTYASGRKRALSGSVLVQ